MSEPAGVLKLDKPAGPTSHDMVAAARRALGVRRIGHTGTLDPFASGLLLLCIGWATRLAEYLTGLPKVYRATIRLGRRTDTDDLTGATLSESDDWRTLDDARIAAALAAQVGTRLQTPPAYSAKKVDGERGYQRARRGEDVALRAVPVTIHRLDVLAVALPDIDVEVECSSGTYIRAIARDAGEELGCGAHLAALRRTRIGEHGVDDAVAPGRLDEALSSGRAWLTPGDALAHLPRIHVDEHEAAALRHGRVLGIDAPDTKAAAVHAPDGLVAVGTVAGGVLRPVKVFPRA